MPTMKAVQFHEYGGPEVLRYEEVPRPEPASGEVLIRIHATSVNPIDWKLRAGHLRAFREIPLPFIPGWDFSGVVESVGSGVTAWKPGDEVYGHPSLGATGTYAEYIAVPEAVCARKPKSIDHTRASAIPLTGLTAWQALFEAAQLSAGQKVLIHAGAGGVGSLAIQFAKVKALVVAATASARNQELLRELGADQPINYEAARFEEVISDADAVIETLGGEVRERSWKALKKGGILVAIIGPPPSEDTAKSYGVRQTLIWCHPDAGQLAEIAGLVDSGKVRPIIEAVLPLAEAAKAHELNQSGHTRGKIVLTVV
jgi:NADPH:quinone reductase-like Zn-dependent oxidoreductase